MSGLPTCADRAHAKTEIKARSRIRLATNSLHPGSPGHADPRGQKGKEDGERHLLREYASRFGIEQITGVIGGGWIVVAEVFGAEHPVARGGRHQEIRHGP